MATVSNLITGASTTLRTFTCAIENASGGYSGTIQQLLDKRFTVLNKDTSATAWEAVRTTGASGLQIVYVAIAVSGTSSRCYVGKAATNLTARYSAAGPTKGTNPSGLQTVFDFYKANMANNPTLDVTIYGTGHPCFIEGWCFQAASKAGYTICNILDPN